MNFSPKTRSIFSRALAPRDRIADDDPARQGIAGAAKPWLAIANNKAERVATIWIYGTITSFKWWDDERAVTDEEVIAALEEIDADEIHVRINSYGGEVFVANAIAVLLAEDPAKIIVHIDGVAASAATIIAMAGDEVLISEGGSFMIHDPWVISVGNAAELRADAAMLDTIKQGIVAKYARRTGIDRDEIAALMEVDTWYSGEEAVEAGFADRISEDEPPAPPEPQQDPPENHSARRAGDPEAPPSETKTATATLMRMRHRRRAHGAAAR